MARERPTGLKKWLFKAPSWLYRARLGFLFGRRFLMMEHRGRRSGRLYHTVVEVAGRKPGTSEWVITAGYGPRTDWYRNLESGNLEAVWIGSSRYHQCSARFLEPPEAAGVLAGYERDHPKTAQVLFGEMDISYDGTDEGRVEMVKAIPMVALQVRH